MPTFALANNLAWEVVYAIYVSEAPLERIIFTAWLIIDCGLIIGVKKYSKYEWSHAPVVAQHMGKIFLVMVLGAVLGHLSFAKWWIDNEIGKKEGKIFRGVVGPDISELGYWTAIFNQLYLSSTSLASLVIRQHSGGVNFSIWYDSISK